MAQEKIKILYGLPSFSIGGMENQLLQQLPHFDPSRYDLHLATLFYYEGRPNLYGSLPAHVTVHQFNFRSAFDIKSWFKLYYTLKDIKPDIVVSGMFSANNVFRVLKLFVGYKIITREHNTYTDRTFWQRILEKSLSPLSNIIIALSKDVADFYCRQNKVNRQKVRVINNGVDLEKIESFKRASFDQVAFRQEFGLASGDRIIINVARLKKQKNHELLINAFNQFQKEQGDFKLLILGDGQERANLTNQINDLGLTGKVMLLGFRDDVYKFYSVSDFFVLTSRIEGFPNVFLEAMAFGLPVITTKVPGALEVIEDGQNGFVVEGEQELLAKMLELSRSSSEKMRETCLKTVEKFDVRRIVDEYDQVFGELLNNK